MIALALVWWPQYARLARGQALQLRELPYVEAAGALGARHGRILFRHMLPNALTPLMVKMSLNVGLAILAKAASFPGPRCPAPIAELGSLVTRGATTSWMPGGTRRCPAAPSCCSASPSTPSPTTCAMRSIRPCGSDPNGRRTHRKDSMLLNRRMAQQLLQDESIDALVVAYTENVISSATSWRSTATG